MATCAAIAAGSVEVNAGREARVSVADAKLLSEAASPAPAAWVASLRLAELVPIDGPAVAPAPPSGEAQPPFGSASASGVAPAPRPAHAATHGPTASAKAAPTTTNDGALRAALRACFDQSHPAAPDGARVAVASTLHLTLRPDGTVSTARFDPPLSPAFQACATKSVLAPHAAGTPSHTLGLSFP